MNRNIDPSFVKEFYERKLLAISNLTRTEEIIQAEEEIKSKLNNLAQTTHEWNTEEGSTKGS